MVVDVQINFLVSGKVGEFNLNIKCFLYGPVYVVCWNDSTFFHCSPSSPILAGYLPKPKSVVIAAVHQIANENIMLHPPRFQRCAAKALRE